MSLNMHDIQGSIRDAVRNSHSSIENSYPSFFCVFVENIPQPLRDKGNGPDIP